MTCAEDRSARVAPRSVVLAWCIAIVGCMNPTIDGVAPPYDPTSLTGGLLYHWAPGRALAVHVASQPAGDDLEPAIRTAIARWIPALAYREQSLRIVARADEADIVVYDRSAPLPVDTTGCGAPGWTESVGRTLFCPAGDSARTLPLIGGPPGRTKVLIAIDVAATADASELLSVAIHEVGHALGIGGHSAVPTDVMFPIPSVAAPSAADARTLRYVVHRRPDLTL
jgi:predicted Zn-dependent protease